ncbi:MAG: hypothetical protein HYW03_02275 [Deltaproteobacteria bacterium]|nr:hypothetical protein [Deltaproteobacteria bacterium]
MNRLARSCSFPVALLVSVSLHGRVAGGAEFRRVTLSYSAVSMTWFPVKIAVEKGFFRSEGLEPQLIQMNGNVATVALANGHDRRAITLELGHKLRRAPAVIGYPCGRRSPRLPI